MNSIWFTADEHHGHASARTGWGKPHMVRPWDNVDDMTRGLIERHNARVRPNDIVRHIGDMFWRTLAPYKALEIMRALNGTHYYTRGNHEELLEDQNLRDCFVDIEERSFLYNLPGCPMIVLDHYAGRTWRNSGHGSWQLYGHSHGMLSELQELRAFDVGVDANNYYPVSLDEVKARMAMKGRTK